MTDVYPAVVREIDQIDETRLAESSTSSSAYDGAAEGVLCWLRSASGPRDGEKGTFGWRATLRRERRGDDVNDEKSARKGPGAGGCRTSIDSAIAGVTKSKTTPH